MSRFPEQPAHDLEQPQAAEDAHSAAAQRPESDQPALAPESTVDPSAADIRDPQTPATPETPEEPASDVVREPEADAGRPSVAP